MIKKKNRKKQSFLGSSRVNVLTRPCSTPVSEKISVAREGVLQWHLTVMATRHFVIFSVVVRQIAEKSLPVLLGLTFFVGK